ncbi:hypothetical protein WSS_A29669 [Rhodococcus opacus M213]|uniref:Uncharacterized protein n=2 Tax=Rhodococcus opacus TaxID=37919 RepID=K8XBS9_RHOOP|nr:hypothetical protein WSS_A29669 [Rhodococcus opacus M213]
MDQQASQMLDRGAGSVIVERGVSDRVAGGDEFAKQPDPGAVTGELAARGFGGSRFGKQRDQTGQLHWTNISALQSGVATLKRGESPAVVTGTGLVSASMTNGFEVIAGTGVFWVP